MSRKRRNAPFVVFLGGVLLASCQSKRSTEAATQSKAATTIASPGVLRSETEKNGDSYQRMKECAEQTDRLTRRAGWVEGRREGEVTLTQWENHYSPKYQRCYVQVFYMNHLATKDKSLPHIYYELWDTFEGRLLTICHDDVISESSSFCTIQAPESPHSDCGACRQFAKDRMNN